MAEKPWYEWDENNESLEECRDRRLRQCPLLTGIQLEALKQLTTVIWDGYLISKCARGDLVDMGLAVKWQGFQVISREGMAVLDTLNALKTNNPVAGTADDR
jgi:hypothetical protein